MILRSHEDTDGLAKVLLEQLPPGSLLVLEGELGAGKTTLVAAIARALGSPAAVTSPTYTLVHEYPTPAGTLVHIDAWRLEDPGAIAQLGLDSYLDDARLVAVEWGAALRESHPEALTVRLELNADGTRTARLEPGEA